MPKGRNQLGEFETEKTMGRPTKWTPGLNDRMVGFFQGEAYREIQRLNPKTGAEYSEFVANKLPFFGEFERKEGIYHGSLAEWAKPENASKYPGFANAYKHCKELQKEFLSQNALMGLTNPTFSIFLAKNITDMRDQVDQRHVDADGQTVAPLTIKVVRPNE